MVVMVMVGTKKKLRFLDRERARESERKSWREDRKREKE